LQGIKVVIGLYYIITPKKFDDFGFGQAGAISKSRNFSGLQKKYKKSENAR
jgi:hypothetical protein